MVDILQAAFSFEFPSQSHWSLGKRSLCQHCWDGELVANRGRSTIWTIDGLVYFRICTEITLVLVSWHSTCKYSAKHAFKHTDALAVSTPSPLRAAGASKCNPGEWLDVDGNIWSITISKPCAPLLLKLDTYVNDDFMVVKVLKSVTTWPMFVLHKWSIMWRTLLWNVIIVLYDVMIYRGSPSYLLFASNPITKARNVELWWLHFS